MIEFLSVIFTILLIVLPIYIIAKLINRRERKKRDKILSQMYSNNEPKGAKNVDLDAHFNERQNKEAEFEDQVFHEINNANSRSEAMNIFFSYQREGLSVGNKAYARFKAWQEYKAWLNEDEYNNRIAEGKSNTIYVWEYQAEKAARFFLAKNSTVDRLKGTRDILSKYVKIRNSELYDRFSKEVFNILKKQWSGHLNKVRKAERDFHSKQISYSSFNPERYLKHLNENIHKLYNEHIKSNN